MPPPLILASTSRYRRELLQRLALPFDTQTPGVDEAERPGEAPRETAARLALEKARAVAGAHPNAVVIGSDQIAEVNGTRLNKPGEHERAVGYALRTGHRDLGAHRRGERDDFDEIGQRHCWNLATD